MPHARELAAALAVLLVSAYLLFFRRSHLARVRSLEQKLEVCFAREISCLRTR